MREAHLRVTATIVVAVVACVGFVLGVLALILVPLKTHPAYRMGMDLVKRDPAVIRLLGSPVRDGLLVAGTTQSFRYGGGIANLETRISGPRARGTASIYGTEGEAGEWQIQSITIRVGGEIVLSYDGSKPVRGFQAR